MLIPHSRPVFDQRVVAASSAVIQSACLAQGQETAQLEHDISAKLAARHVLAVDSGTSALMLAIRQLTGKKTGAKVGIPAYACASLLFAVKAANAVPVFMDCDASLCLDREQALATAKTLDVLVLVHPFGLVDSLVTEPMPCPVIEDIAQSVGATLHGKLVGTLSDISIGSLYATKPWGGAYGGFITSTDKSMISSIRAMTDPDHAALESPYVGHHQLSDLHACVAIERLLNAEKEQDKRQSLSAKYDALIQATSAFPIQYHADTKPNYFRYIIQTASDNSKNNADEIIKAFRAIGIAASLPVQQPLHRVNPAYNCPQAELAWSHCVSLPMLANMSDIEFAHMKIGIEQCLPS